MKPWLQATIIVSISITIIIVVICLTVFGVESLHASSKRDMGSLGQTGDFIGGTIGTVAAVIGVALTAFIALSVNRLQARLAKMSMDHSLELIRYQRRQQEFIAFMGTCDRLIREISPEDAQLARLKLGLLMEATDRISLQFKELDGNASTLREFAKKCFSFSNFLIDKSIIQLNSFADYSLIFLLYRESISDLSDWVETGKVSWTNVDEIKIQDPP